MPSRSRGILISASAAVRTTSRNISLTAVAISAELLDGWLLTYAFNRFRENSVHFLLVFLLLTAPNFFMLSSAAVYTKIYGDTKTISWWTTSLRAGPSRQCGGFCPCSDNIRRRQQPPFPAGVCPPGQQELWCECSLKPGKRCLPGSIHASTEQAQFPNIRRDSLPVIQSVTPSLPCAKAERPPMVTAVYAKNFADFFALFSLILRFSHYFLFPSHGVLALLVSANVFF